MIRATLGLAITIGAMLVQACGGPPETSRPVPPVAAPREPIPEATAKAPPEAVFKAMLAPATGDLDSIRARGFLRVLVVPSRTHYAVEDGLQRGSTVDAGIAFEVFLNAKWPASQPIQVVFVPTPENALVKDLIAGRGDMAANLRQTFERDDLVAFSAPIRSGIREVVVTGPGVPALVSLEDVAGRSIHVRGSSDHHASLIRLNDQLRKIDRPPCNIVIADEKLTDEDLLELVNQGKIPATLADEYVFEAWQRQFGLLATNRDVAVSQDGIIAWATRKAAPQLRALVNEFFKTHRPSDHIR